MKGCLLANLDHIRMSCRLKKSTFYDSNALIGYSFMRFRGDNAIGGSLSGQFAPTMQTQACPSPYLHSYLPVVPALPCVHMLMSAECRSVLPASTSASFAQRSRFSRCSDACLCSKLASLLCATMCCAKAACLACCNLLTAASLTRPMSSVAGGRPVAVQPEEAGVDVAAGDQQRQAGDRVCDDRAPAGRPVGQDPRRRRRLLSSRRRLTLCRAQYVVATEVAAAPSCAKTRCDCLMAGCCASSPFCGARSAAMTACSEVAGGGGAAFCS